MIESLSSKFYAPDPSLRYADVLGLHDFYDKLAFESNLVLVGPKGSSKSLSLAAYAAKIGCPIVTFDCSEDVRRAHLYGSFILRGNESPFILGPVPTAFEIANETGQCVLCLEELNTLSAASQKLLNPLLDFRRKIELPEAKKVFRLRDGAKIWFVGTMNFNSYGGTYELNEDLKSRVRLAPLGYPTLAQEDAIVNFVLKGALPDQALVRSVLRLAEETRKGGFAYALSTRDVIQLLQDIVLLGPEKALWLVSGKFEGTDRTTLERRVLSIFNVELEGAAVLTRKAKAKAKADGVKGKNVATP